MRCFIFTCLFLLSFSQAFYAQDSLRSSVNLTLGMNRLDFQSGIGYSYSFDRFQAFSSLEFGINRTIFQSRAFPRLTLGGAYKLVRRHNFYFGPLLSYSHSALKINQQSNHFTNWNELYVGARMEIGAKWRFVYSMATGWLNERFYSSNLLKKTNVNSIGFYVNIGLAYAW